MAYTFFPGTFRNWGFMLRIPAFNKNENLWICAHSKLVQFEWLRVYSQRMSTHRRSVSEHREGCWPYRLGERSENPKDEYISPGRVASGALHRYPCESVRGGLCLNVQNISNAHPPRRYSQTHLTSYSSFLPAFCLEFPLKPHIWLRVCACEDVHIFLTKQTPWIFTFNRGVIQK